MIHFFDMNGHRACKRRRELASAVCQRLCTKTNVRKAPSHTTGDIKKKKKKWHDLLHIVSWEYGYDFDRRLTLFWEITTR